MNKKGFVLMETIIVVAVLGVILVTLYASFSTIVIGVRKTNYYDNTEYIYKTNIIKGYLKADPSYANIYEPQQVHVVCSEEVGTVRCDKDYMQDLQVQAIYIVDYDPFDITTTTNMDSSGFSSLEATTQKYIKYLDPPDSSGTSRIIVMFKDEDDTTKYQYASLKWE